MNKAQLEKENSLLKADLESTKADCSILLKENLDLIEKVKALDANFNENELFTSQWRSDAEDDT